VLNNPRCEVVHGHAEFERAMICERVCAGLEKPGAKGKRGHVSGGGVGAVGRWPAEATATSLA
jgi:DNA invertase Pin-like site-specific DNA recombinase